MVVKQVVLTPRTIDVEAWGSSLAGNVALNDDHVDLAVVTAR